MIATGSTFYNSSFGAGSLPTLLSTSSSSTVAAALENLKTVIKKRNATCLYLREAYSGDTYWCQTVLLTKEDLMTAFDHHKMRSRTTRFAILGMSLSALLDINVAQDFLRGLLSLMQEFDSVPDDKFDRKNQRSLFKGSALRKRGNAGGADFSAGLQDSGDASFLFTPNIPFELDYFQVLFTLCDLLAQTYQKMQSFLGSSSSTPSGATLTPSIVFPEPPSHEADYLTHKGLFAPSLSAASSEMVVKIDGRLKKIISLLVKDLDGVARLAVKSQLLVFSGGKDWGSEQNYASEAL